MNMQVGGPNSIGQTSLQSMDLETALMMVQTRRNELIEDQLRGQLAVVQSRNDQIASLNTTMTQRSTEINELKTSVEADQKKIAELEAMKNQLGEVHGRDPNGWTGLSWGWGGDNHAASHDMLSRVRAEGLTDVGPTPRDIDRNGTMDAHGSTVKGWMDQLDQKISALQQRIETSGQEIRGKETEITSIKGQIDSVSNSQQMEMLRLQSLSNKRNESFDLMTNFMKKMQDNRSSIMSNMR